MMPQQNVGKIDRSYEEFGEDSNVTYVYEWVLYFQASENT